MNKCYIYINITKKIGYIKEKVASSHQNKWLGQWVATTQRKFTQVKSQTPYALPQTHTGLSSNTLKTTKKKKNSKRTNVLWNNYSQNKPISQPNSTDSLKIKFKQNFSNQIQSKPQFKPTKELK